MNSRQGGKTTTIVEFFFFFETLIPTTTLTQNSREYRRIENNVSKNQENSTKVKDYKKITTDC